MHGSYGQPLRVAALLLGLGAVPVLADCPPDCVAGGGPAATDCFVQFSGVTGTAVTCTDGEACDADGVADGVCSFALQACQGAASASCAATPLDAAPTVAPAASAPAQALAAALAALGPAATGCTAPGVVTLPVKVSLAGLKPAKAKLTVVAAAGGKRDRDKVRLVCQPNPVAPSLATTVQPILTARCATVGCHAGPAPGGAQNLEPGQSYGSSVNVPATVPKFVRVKPGSLKASLMARKILGGSSIPRGAGAEMPQGCPAVPPTGGCLTPQEMYTILAWIKNGAPNN